MERTDDIEQLMYAMNEYRNYANNTMNEYRNYANNTQRLNAGKSHQCYECMVGDVLALSFFMARRERVCLKNYLIRKHRCKKGLESLCSHLLIFTFRHSI